MFPWFIERISNVLRLHVVWGLHLFEPSFYSQELIRWSRWMTQFVSCHSPNGANDSPKRWTKVLLHIVGSSCSLRNLTLISAAHLWTYLNQQKNGLGEDTTVCFIHIGFFFCWSWWTNISFEQLFFCTTSTQMGGLFEPKHSQDALRFSSSGVKLIFWMRRNGDKWLGHQQLMMMMMMMMMIMLIMVASFFLNVSVQLLCFKVPWCAMFFIFYCFLLDSERGIGYNWELPTLRIGCGQCSSLIAHGLTKLMRHMCLVKCLTLPAMFSKKYS